MKLSRLKNLLANLNKVEFYLENGTSVPEHFHVTELGIISKHFIDCGGTIRQEKVANFQVWNANDTDHRLTPEKLLKIIEISEEKLSIEDLEIEIEYQQETIGKYDLDFLEGKFLLKNKHTDCLAKDNCGVPKEKQKLQLIQLGKENACCTPESSCC